MILSGHPSIFLGYCLSDTSKEMLIWSNSILDKFRLKVSHKSKIKLLQINTGVVRC